MYEYTHSYVRYAAVAVDHIEESDTWIVLLLSASTVFAIQVPWLFYHARTVHDHVHGPYPSALWKPTPFFNVLAKRPTCKFWTAPTLGKQCHAVVHLLEYVVCLPFHLGFQGQWVEHAESLHPGIYIYIYIITNLIYVCVCVCVCVYIYVSGRTAASLLPGLVNLTRVSVSLVSTPAVRCSSYIHTRIHPPHLQRDTGAGCIYGIIQIVHVYHHSCIYYRASIP